MVFVKEKTLVEPACGATGEITDSGAGNHGKGDRIKVGILKLLVNAVADLNE